MQRFLLIPFAALTAFLGPALALAAEHAVSVGPGNVFAPRALTIAVGDSVTWTNNGGVHNVRADDNSFRCAAGCDGGGGDGSPSTAGWSFTLTFNDPGLIRYFCEVHGAPGGIGMSGTVTVEGNTDGEQPGEDPPPAAQPTRFRSGFEVPDFTDWDGRVCPACNLVSAEIGEGESLFLPDAEGYATEGAGEHWAYLEGPADADLDLFLLQWIGSEWIPVASGTSLEARESVRYDGGPGRYRWEVRSASGAGEFTLAFNNPDLAGVANELIRSEEAARRGRFGLESAYFQGDNRRDFLIYDLPVTTTRLEAEFWIKPLADLLVEGTKHQVLQLMEGGRSIVRLFVQAPAANEDDHRLVAQVRRGDNAFSTRAFATLKTDRWSRIRVFWKAASEPEASDGVVRLRVGQEVVWEIKDLDNAAHRINRIRFGQTSKGSKATAGQIYYDNFKAKWSPSPVD